MRLSYYGKDDAYCCYVALAYSRLHIGTTHAEDVALVLHGGHLLAPCLWAEVQTTPSGFMYCPHLDDKTGKIVFPCHLI